MVCNLIKFFEVQLVRNELDRLSFWSGAHLGDVVFSVSLLLFRLLELDDFRLDIEVLELEGSLLHDASRRIPVVVLGLQLNLAPARCLLVRNVGIPEAVQQLLHVFSGFLGAHLNSNI